MKKSTFILVILGISLLMIGSIFFITYENDHTECKTVVEYSTGKSGEKIKTVKHICKETWNF